MTTTEATSFTTKAAAPWNSMNDWQPIETAPKDGTTILAVDALIQDTHAVVYYDDGLYPGSIYVWHVTDTTIAYHRDRFTHWMPLPAQPPQEPKT